MGLQVDVNKSQIHALNQSHTILGLSFIYSFTKDCTILSNTIITNNMFRHLKFHPWGAHFALLKLHRDSLVYRAGTATTSAATLANTATTQNFYHAAQSEFY